MELLQFIENGKQRSLTPQEYANEIKAGTPFGQQRITFYIELSVNRGEDPMERVSGYNRLVEEFKKLK